MASTALALAQYFAQFPGPHKAVVESTGGWYWLADTLAALGVELILPHATRVKAIAAAGARPVPAPDPQPDVQRLLWIPGLGKVNAFTTYAEIDGIARFPSARQFFSYCRLVPGADNSAGHRREGGEHETRR